MALFSDAILLAEITVVGRTKRKRRRDCRHVGPGGRSCGTCNHRICLLFTDRRRFSRQTELWQCRCQLAFGHDWKWGFDALMSLLQSDSNQVAGRFLDQQVRWRRYLVVFVGPRLRRSAPPTIPCPQTIHGLLMGQAAKTIAFMSMVAATIAECIARGRVEKPPGEHCGTFNCEPA